MQKPHEIVVKQNSPWKLDVENYTCATPSRLPGEWVHARTNSFTPFPWHQSEFHTRMKITLLHSELALVWLAPVWYFVLVSWKWIWSHKREPEWTRTRKKVVLISCKHPLISPSTVTTFKYMYVSMTNDHQIWNESMKSDQSLPTGSTTNIHVY